MNLRQDSTIATDLETAVMERRAVRRFTPEVVDREIIEGLLSAAVIAPSAMNLQLKLARFRGKLLIRFRVSRQEQTRDRRHDLT